MELNIDAPELAIVAATLNGLEVVESTFGTVFSAKNPNDDCVLSPNRGFVSTGFATGIEQGIDCGALKFG